MTPYLKASNLSQYEILNNGNQLSTSTPNDNCKAKKNSSTKKIARKLKSSEVKSTMKEEMSRFSDSSSNELQDSLKQQVFLARTWVKRNIVPSRDTTLSFCVILIAYHHFCKENDQLPLKPNDLLQILYSSMDCDMSSGLDDQSLKTNEITLEYLSTLTELKLEEAAAAANAGQNKQDDFKDLQNLRLKCDFIKLESGVKCGIIKIESDEAYESDLSDSDMKEINNDFSVSEYKNSEERDSSYESYDETSNEAIYLHVGHDGKGFTKESFSRSSPTKLSNSLDTSKERDVSETLKVSLQTPKVFVGEKRQIDDDDRHNTLLPPPKKMKWSEEQRRVIVNMKGLLEFHLQNYVGSVCYDHAKSLSETLVEMLQRKQLKYFLEEFGHAMSCGEEHGSLCFMFKRVVHHVLQANHECALKNIYGHILRLHLDTCNEDCCGFPNCKLRREERKERLMKQQELKMSPTISIN